MSDYRTTHVSEVLALLISDLTTVPALLVNRDVTSDEDYDTDELCARCGDHLGTAAVAVETRVGDVLQGVEFVCGTCENNPAFRLQPE